MKSSILLIGVLHHVAVAQWQPCSSGACCNPQAATPQLCPGGIKCQECGGGTACQCPGSGPSPSPTPAPPPSPPPSPPPVPPPGPHPSPTPPHPSSGIGFCGVGGDVPSQNEAEWGPRFKSANINWFWNWDIAPKSTDYVPEDWNFLPCIWSKGAGPAPPNEHAQHSGPGASTYNLAPILLGWNEPDIVGMCVSQPEIATPAQGLCHEAGSMGWWFPDEIHNPLTMIDDWYYQVDKAVATGYGVTSPMVAEQTGETWLKPFVRTACAAGRCPEYLNWHFYVMGCHDSEQHFAGFRQKLKDSVDMIQENPTIKGVIITEAGILKLEVTPGVKPAATCPDSTKVAIMKKMFAIMKEPQYNIKGESVVKHFSWFSKDGDGATYMLALVDPSSGAMRALGDAYVDECGQWGAARDHDTVVHV